MVVVVVVAFLRGKQLFVNHPEGNYLPEVAQKYQQHKNKNSRIINVQ